MKNKTKFTLISLLLIFVISIALLTPGFTVFAETTDNSAGSDIGKADGDVDGDGVVEESGNYNTDSGEGRNTEGGVIGGVESGIENVESGAEDLGSDIASGFGTDGDTQSNQSETDPGVVESNKNEATTNANNNSDKDNDTGKRMSVTGIIIAIIIAVAVIAIIIALIPKKRDK